METEIKTKASILLIEDEPLMTEMLADKLKEKNFSVQTALNGVTGLAKALKYHPDLIILDIVMPKMDGLTMLKKLRGDSWGQDVKVILLTNLNGADKKAEAVEGKMHEYLVKSDWTLSGIVRKVEDRLGFI